MVSLSWGFCSVRSDLDCWGSSCDPLSNGKGIVSRAAAHETGRSWPRIRMLLGWLGTIAVQIDSFFWLITMEWCLMIIHEQWTFDYLQFVPGFWGIGKSFRGSVQMSMIGRRWKMFLNKSSLIQFSVLSFPDEGLACLPSKIWASIIMLALPQSKLCRPQLE